MVRLEEVVISNNNIPNNIPNRIDIEQPSYISYLVKLFGIIIICLTIIGFYVLNCIGIGYMTEYIFTKKSIDSYETWQVDLMKMAIVIYWITIIINLIKSCREQFIQK
jgi:hypothetical protein